MLPHYDPWSIFMYRKAEFLSIRDLENICITSKKLHKLCIHDIRMVRQRMSYWSPVCISFALNIDQNNYSNILEIMNKTIDSFKTSPKTKESTHLMVKQLVFRFTSHENIGIEKDRNIEEGIRVLCIKYLIGNTLDFPFIDFPIWCEKTIFNYLFIHSTIHQQRMILNIMDSIIISNHFGAYHVSTLYFKLLLPLISVVSVYNLLDKVHTINQTKSGIFMVRLARENSKFNVCRLKKQCKNIDESLNIECTDNIQDKSVMLISIKPTCDAVDVENIIKQIRARIDIFRFDEYVNGQEFFCNERLMKLIATCPPSKALIKLIYELIKADNRYIEFYQKYINDQWITESIQYILELIKEKGINLDIITIQIILSKSVSSSLQIDNEYIFNVNPIEWLDILRKLECHKYLNYKCYILNMIKMCLRKQNVSSYIDIEWNLLDESYCNEILQFILTNTGLIKMKLQFYIKQLKKTNSDIKCKEMTKQNLENAIKLIWKINNKLKKGETFGYEVESFNILYAKIKKTKVVKPILNKLDSKHIF